jgi:hypothetical protein
VEAVIDALAGHAETAGSTRRAGIGGSAGGAVRVVEREITRENIRFTLPPKTLRS